MAEETCELTVPHPAWGGARVPEGERRKRARARLPALTILFHPDARRVGEQALLANPASGRVVLLSRNEPGFAAPGSADLRPLADLHLSRSPLRIGPGKEPGSCSVEVAGSRTRLAIDGVWVPEGRELSAAEVQRGTVLELAERVVLYLHTLSTTSFTAPPAHGLIGESEVMLRIRNEIRRVAELDLPVLIRGETGTGKELAARAIHQASRRRNATCLCVNMGAIPATLATSELFGSAKGSFTGAVRDQAGYFQRAHGGTLFLDEIGEAPPEVQVLLLRVLETGEIQRVGSPEVQKVDVRLIAATDSDLEKAIEDGRFRAPLFHRLSGYEMLLPPLRERREDFGRLFFHFLRDELRAIGEERRLDPPEGTAPSWLPASIVARLVRHPWPGNIRQLRNAVRQIVVDSRASDSVQVGPLLERLLREAAQPEAVEAEPAVATPSPVTPVQMSADLPRRRAQAAVYRSPSEVGEAELLEALRASHWEIKAAAAQLGISRPALYLLMDKFPGIRKASDLSRSEILEARELCGGDLNAMVSRLEVSKKGLLQRMSQLGIV
jgi:two-component system, NtrC family, nitrogen regulation response regulator GlnG